MSEGGVTDSWERLKIFQTVHWKLKSFITQRNEFLSGEIVKFSDDRTLCLNWKLHFLFNLWAKWDHCQKCHCVIFQTRFTFSQKAFLRFLVNISSASRKCPEWLEQCCSSWQWKKVASPTFYHPPYGEFVHRGYTSQNAWMRHFSSQLFSVWQFLVQLDHHAS